MTALAAAVGFTSAALAAHWFGWRLVVVIVLALWANNLGRQGRA